MYAKHKLTFERPVVRDGWSDAAPDYEREYALPATLVNMSARSAAVVIGAVSSRAYTATLRLPHGNCVPAIGWRVTGPDGTEYGIRAVTVNARLCSVILEAA